IADIDECVQATDNCDSNAECNNTVGSFTCTCHACYSGDGINCTNINECTEGSHDCAQRGGICANTPGGYNCSCDQCYNGDGRSCSLITCENLTAPSNGAISGDGTVCGSRVAYSCTSGYRLKGDSLRECKRDGSWSGKEPECADVNECKEKTHNCDTANGVCSNTGGSYKCSCKKCYTLNGVSCELLHCSNLSAPIHGRLSSLDTGCGSVVSFSCLDGFARSSGSQKRKCNPKGRWSGKSLLCKDINECSKGHDCDKVKGSCKNTIGSYQCSCKPGFFGDGRKCSDTYTVEGRVIDASDGSAIRTARVFLGNRLKTTNTNGFFSFRNVPGLTFILNASANGYVSNTKEINVTSDIGRGIADIILVKVLKSGTWKIVVTWGEEPRDLDAYLKLPDGRQISYFEREFQSENSSVILDIDDTSRFGPETITINEGSQSGIYRHYVNAYTADFSRGQGTAELYNGNSKVATLTSPLGKEKYWVTFLIDTGIKKFTIINKLTNFPDTEEK
ncbi:fibrillin-1-like, partial [Corticium candelabrum]|uniref:fibrillin-1-like n=1 Tax=Corticium candelabrum TaxID=121492 RepID=UPI002E264912